MNLFSSLINNISANFRYLSQDFTGISVNPQGIILFLIYCIIPAVIIVIFYLVGSKIKNAFFRETHGLVDFFIKIALGYIFVASGFLILGMLGMFYQGILYLYYIVLIIVTLYPLNTLRMRLGIFLEIFNDYKKQFVNNKLVNIAILSFVLIGFLRIITPEVGIDAIWYHTDYPKIYLNTHSMMTIDPRGKFYPAVTPTLSDMLYVFTQSLSLKDSSRYIHFSFYILSILTYLTVFRKKFSFIPYAALLIVTSPIVIRISSSAYAEFQWIFCWLLAIFLITLKNKHNLKDIVLPAILVGATFATKLWMLPFYGVFVLYLLVLNIKLDKIKLIKLLSVFTIISFSIPFLWYLRAFLITGNPLFPTFWNYSDGSPNNPFTFSTITSTFNLEGLKMRTLSALNVSPLSIIGFIFILPLIRKINKTTFSITPIYLFITILTITQIIINYSIHRFVIPFYSIFAILLAIGVEKFIKINRIFKYSFYILFSIFFLYYFINTLLILPYGLGFANKNKYLSRVLSRDNSSFYDYNNQFLKRINKNEIVAVYGLYGFYYANFSYIHMEDIFRKIKRSIGVIKKLGASKLLILGGDIVWLCKTERLTDCSENNYKLITDYKFPTTASSQYLYEIK